MSKTGDDLVNEARQRIVEVSARDVAAMLERGDAPLLLDVREPNEWNLGHLPGAMHVPRGLLETRIERVLPRDRHIVVYCAVGNRSALAADTLARMGYVRVASMIGGIRDWVDQGGSVED
jgi:rhodanese-related sulfurtransferase